VSGFLEGTSECRCQCRVNVTMHLIHRGMQGPLINDVRGRWVPSGPQWAHNDCAILSLGFALFAIHNVWSIVHDGWLVSMGLAAHRVWPVGVRNEMMIVTMTR